MKSFRSVAILAILGLFILLSACAPRTQARPEFAPFTGEPLTVYLLANDESAVGAIEVEAFQNPAFSQRFTLIDQNAVDIALEQVAGAQRGLLEESTIAQVGGVLGVKHAVSVRVNFRDTRGRSLGLFDNMLDVGGDVETEAQISMRILDVETGTVMAVGAGSSDRHDNAGEALAEAAQKAVDQLLVSYVSREG